MFKTDSVRLRLWAAQEAMHGSTRVLVVSRDLSAPVNAHGVGGLLSYVNARGVECGERAVRCLKETVIRGARVCVGSRDRTGVVNTRRRGSFDAARRVERGQCAVRGPQKAVRQKIVVVVVPGNRSAPVDAQ